MNNATLLMADRTAHLKIVVSALVASIAVITDRSCVEVEPAGFERLLRTTTRIIMPAANQIASTQAAN